MNPLHLLEGKQRLAGRQLDTARIKPMAHKRLIEQGRCRNPEIDAVFVMLLQLQTIGSLRQSKAIYTLAADAVNAMARATDNAADKGLMVITPSTDQRRVIFRALETLSSLTETITVKTYTDSLIYAELVYSKREKEAA